LPRSRPRETVPLARGCCCYLRSQVPPENGCHVRLLRLGLNARGVSPRLALQVVAGSVVKTLVGLECWSVGRGGVATLSVVHTVPGNYRVSPSNAGCAVHAFASIKFMPQAVDGECLYCSPV